jgi:hypothetical protein
MKINKITLLIILFGVLIFSTLSNNLIEGMSNTEVSGITRNEIPKGQEDLYILKSQALPPNCPVCPDISKQSTESKCQPCPPCGRCPEPAFECKKVPNYKRFSKNNNFKPLLADFSNF